jgi:hypothetical protein
MFWCKCPKPNKTPAEAIRGAILKTTWPIVWLLGDGRAPYVADGVRLTESDWPAISEALSAAGYEVRPRS